MLNICCFDWSLCTCGLRGLVWYLYIIHLTGIYGYHCLVIVYLVALSVRFNPIRVIGLNNFCSGWGQGLLYTLCTPQKLTANTFWSFSFEKFTFGHFPLLIFTKFHMKFIFLHMEVIFFSIIFLFGHFHGTPHFNFNVTS